MKNRFDLDDKFSFKNSVESLFNRQKKYFSSDDFKSYKKIYKKISNKNEDVLSIILGYGSTDKLNGNAEDKIYFNKGIFIFKEKGIDLYYRKSILPFSETHIIKYPYSKIFELSLQIHKPIIRKKYILFFLNEKEDTIFKVMGNNNSIVYGLNRLIDCHKYNQGPILYVKKQKFINKSENITDGFEIFLK